MCLVCLFVFIYFFIIRRSSIRIFICHCFCIDWVLARIFVLRNIHIFGLLKKDIFLFISKFNGLIVNGLRHSVSKNGIARKSVALLYFCLRHIISSFAYSFKFNLCVCFKFRIDLFGFYVFLVSWFFRS